MDEEESQSGDATFDCAQVGVSDFEKCVAVMISQDRGDRRHHPHDAKFGGI